MSVGIAVATAFFAMCWAVTCVTYFDAAHAQFQHDAEERNPQLHAMIILALRSAAILPLLASCYIVPIVDPTVFQPVDIATSVFEGYSIRCFLLLIVAFFGGREQTAAAGRVSMLPVELAVWQFAYIRPIMVFLLWVFLDVFPVRVAYAVIFLVTGASAIVCVIGLVYLIVGVYDDAAPILIGTKFCLIKILIGLITIENTIRLVLLHLIAIQDRKVVISGPNTSLSAVYAAWYSRIALLQLAIVSSLVPFSFKPRMAAVDRGRPQEEEEEEGEEGRKQQTITTRSFLFDLVAVWRVLPHEPANIVGHPGGATGLLSSPKLMFDDPSTTVPLLDAEKKAVL
ncbi:hypothetical protein CTAYLR_002472 [Chrysophaeum taylorii]|uniref:Uncharacterized protein n=1 Tax=Chrysophaeum taylorii TaxID=2483200 RepID=A0AAD7XML3_9STRA|nr:hypothetical protein CTAYLR_002472 [Chrysophaeum taylorii]